MKELLHLLLADPARFQRADLPCCLWGLWDAANEEWVDPVPAALRVEKPVALRIVASDQSQRNPIHTLEALAK